jgi:hypothetical protein
MPICITRQQNARRLPNHGFRREARFIAAWQTMFPSLEGALFGSGKFGSRAVQDSELNKSDA